MICVASTVRCTSIANNALTEIEQRKFDVLLSHPCMTFSAPPIARCTKMPTVLYLQDPCRHLYEAIPAQKWALPQWMDRGQFHPSYFLKFLRDVRHVYGLRFQVREEIASARAFSRILVNSIYSRESILRAYGLESHFCRLGIDNTKFRPSGKHRGRYVVGVGSISVAKGVDRVIRALASIEMSNRPELMWIGNFSNAAYESDIRALAKETGVTLTTKIMVDDNQLIQYLSEAACMVYAPRLEPFGLAPLEGNACGTPVVALAEGGVRETLIDKINGFLITSADPHAFGCAVEQLCRETILADEMGKQARRYVIDNWSWERAVTELEQNLAAALRHTDIEDPKLTASSSC